MANKIGEINELKESLRFRDDKIKSLKRETEAIKRMSPIEIAKYLPLGIFLLILGLLFALAADFTFLHQFGRLLFGLNLLSSVVPIYVGAKLTVIGLKYKKMDKKRKEFFSKPKNVK